MAKKQDQLTSFRPQDYSGFVQSTLALEKAKAQDPMAGFAAFATPILTELDRQAGVVAKAKETFLENMPDDFQVELVSPELKGQLTEKLKDYKTEYLEGVDLLSKHANNPNSMEYKRGVEITEGAKNKMMNTYNGLVKLQQDRTFEINNANSRGYNETANTALADQLVIGLNASQVTYDENGNPIYNSGLEGVNPINVNDYKRTTTFDKNSLNSINTQFVDQPYNLGAKGYDKGQFDIINKNYASSISGNKQLADQLFFMGVTGDNNGETAILNHIEKVNNDSITDNDLIPLERGANGKVIPPSKSANNMNALKNYLVTMGEDSYANGAKQVKIEAEKERINIPNLGGYVYPGKVREFLQNVDSGKNIKPLGAIYHYKKEANGKWRAYYISDNTPVLASGNNFPISFNSNDELKEYFDVTPFVSDKVGYEYTAPATSETTTSTTTTSNALDDALSVVSEKEQDLRDQLSKVEEEIQGLTSYYGEGVFKPQRGLTEYLSFSRRKAKRLMKEKQDLEKKLSKFEKPKESKTNDEGFSGELSEEASEIINSYQDAEKLEAAINDGTITNKEVIAFVNMLKTENA